MYVLENLVKVGP